jgi:hydroxyacylglutathione hydrolase
MKLSMMRLVLGPLQNNVYLLADEDSQDAVVIDPSFGSETVLVQAERQGWHLRQVWITHAHYDHIAGVAALSTAFDPPLPVGMHADAYAWLLEQEHVVKFGVPIDLLPEPGIFFKEGQQLTLTPGGQEFAVEVRHAPGHSPGSVIFYCASLGVAFCGDVIFRASIGRTDLPGGHHDTLIESIHTQVLSLPESTTLLPGHGPESSVGFERLYNPYLA